MIKLISLKLQGFRKFTNPVEIVFPDSGMMLLEGDSGSGKSTILQAISYIFDACPFPATVLKSWTGEKMQVVLNISVDGEPVELARGTNTYVQRGSVIKTGSKAYLEEIKSIIGMDPELLGALTYRPQDTLGLFLSKDDESKKEFLSKVLGLEPIERLLEKTDVAKKQLSDKLSFAQGTLTEREAALAKMLEQFNEVSPEPLGGGDLVARVEACTTVVESIEKEVADLKDQLSGAVKGFQERALDEARAKQAKYEQGLLILEQVRAKNRKQTKDFYNRAGVLKEQFLQTQNELTQINALHQKVAALTAEVDSLKQNKCYVCHQPFVAEAAIDQKLEQIEQFKERLSHIPALESRKQDLLGALQIPPPAPDPVEEKLATSLGQLENELKWIGKTITDANVLALERSTQERTKTLYKAKSDLAMAVADLDRFKVQVETKQHQTRKIKVQVDEASKKVNEQRELVAKITEDLNLERDIEAALGKEGFLGVIFEEILSEIATEANDILGRLPNTSGVSVFFKSETNKGKRSIVPVFRVGSFETTRSAGLSGGMGSSADLAVDLGVCVVVERRLGQAPGWLCLDETFNGMPVVTKERALEVLQQFAENRLVLVVDHGSELRASFKRVLTVTEDSGITLL